MPKRLPQQAPRPLSAATAAESTPTPIAKFAAIGARGVPTSDDQNMPRKVKVARPDKGGSKQLELAAARQVREDAGASWYAPPELEAEVVDDDAVDNVVVDLDNVHNEIEADIVTEAEANKMAKQKREAVANVAAPTAAALPSDMSAFSLKQNGEPRKTERAAVAGGDDEDGDGDDEEEG
ncbi:hypothetical protein T492DRAFT_886116 [Pavlovales sp. CCMP2436]|nr:hypothetical protein T492DRAFT_886116 [Pavlovales sp. CCMP2436]